MSKPNGFSSIIILIIAIVFILGIGFGYVAFYKPKQDAAALPNVPQESSDLVSQVTNAVSGMTQNIAKHQVTKTALPLGDNRYSTTAPKVGYIYMCRVQAGGGGAAHVGPWINSSAGTWDLTQKPTVDGKVSWPSPKITITDDGTTRTITSNGYPYHTTGVYPIASTDDAYSYDRNPNSIKQQSYTFTLPVNPTLLSSPECVGGEVGIMLSGIPIFNGFDADSRDAVANEVQDTCGGHPEKTGGYHYHGPSTCIKDETVENDHSALEGYAFDGFGIYGVKGENGVELSTEDLDECHGHTHTIASKQVSTYHYHMTYDFPYSVSCFRGKKSVNGPLGGASSSTNSSGSQQGQMSGPGGARPGGQMPPPPPNF
jgi:hypothetical protein